MTQTVISLDCEANGLHGQVFAVAAAIYEDGRAAGAWQRRCPIGGSVDPWVAENVLPGLTDMPVLCGSYPGLLAAWLAFVGAYDLRSTLVVTHVPWPVEARFLWDAHGAEPFSGPYPLVDVASMLLAHREAPRSVDAYLDQMGIVRPVGSPHHPLYDARAAALAYFHLIGASS